jgi:RNA polymerase sigma factor (sigma-70 family)
MTRISDDELRLLCAGYQGKLSPEVVRERHARYLAGDDAAGHDLLNSVAPWVLTIVGRHCPGRDAEELFQAANMHLWERLRDFNPDRAQLSTWAFWRTRAALARAQQREDRHEYARVTAKAGRTARLDQNDEDGVPFRDRIADDREPDPADEAGRRDDADHVRDVLKQILPSRAAVVSERIEGAKLHEVAARLGVTRQRVQQLDDAGRREFRLRWLSDIPMPDRRTDAMRDDANDATDGEAVSA